ncbi:MAG: matrixin family metalloprotease, partial [Actinomycetota bacterium]|nr:matrixin family metalloprotease [Actinomycetota bacterium]
MQFELAEALMRMDRDPEAEELLERCGPVLEEAIQRWVAAGADETFQRGLDVRISDLSTGIVGQTALNTIYVDRTAAGNGWYVDSTPADDAEFNVDGPGYLAWAPEGTSANDGIDLLTVLMHEIGHQLGFPHDGTVDSLMRASMAEGMRVTTPYSGDPALIPNEPYLGQAGAQDDQTAILAGLVEFGSWAGDLGDGVNDYFSNQTLPLIDMSMADIFGDGLTAGVTSITDAITDGIDVLHDAINTYFADQALAGLEATVEGMINTVAANTDVIDAGIQIARSGTSSTSEFMVTIRVAGYDQALDLNVDALGGFLSVSGDQLGVEASVDLSFIFGLDDDGNFYMSQPGVNAGFQVGYEAYDIVAIVTDDNGAAAGGNAQFSIAGNRSAEFVAGNDIAILDTYGNDGFYHVIDVVYDVDTGATVITVEGDVEFDVVEGTLRNTYDFGLNVGPFGVEVNNGIIGVYGDVYFGTDAMLTYAEMQDANNSVAQLLGMPDLGADAGYEIFLPVSMGGLFDGIGGQLGAISAFSGDLPVDASILEMIAAFPSTVKVTGFDDLFDMSGISLDMIIEGLYMVLDKLVGAPQDGSGVATTVSVPQEQVIGFNGATASTSGVFKLTIAGATTADITWADDDVALAGAIQTALDDALGNGFVTVTNTVNSDEFSLVFRQPGDHAACAADLTGITIDAPTFDPVEPADIIDVVAVAGTSETQTVTVSATGGTFTLSLGKVTTDAIAWNADAAAIAAALNLKLGAGKVAVVAGVEPNSFDITFAEDGNQALLKANTDALGVKEVQTLTFAGGTASETFMLSQGGALSAAITWNATEATLLASMQAAVDATWGAGAIVVATTAENTFTFTFATVGDEA